ncbi:hypothetical protein FACS1894172_03900 [Spirochaetia bacterium]|nr:hypothetical protein FACS1894172_03900 [Spirochaetia bacterium]
MVYRTKLILLTTIIGLLMLVLAGTVVFDPDRVSSKNSAFAWLDSKDLTRIDTIDITGPSSTVNLHKTGDSWSVVRNGSVYPAKESRVEDLIRILARTDSYPVYSSTASAQGRLGLDPDSASKISIRAGESPILDLFLGSADAAGTGRFMRKNGSDEIRSGQDKLSGYVESSFPSWCNLRLFPDTLAPDSVQQLSITGADRTFVLARNQHAWNLGDSPADSQKVDSYLRSLLSAEAEDFDSDPGVLLDEYRITIESGTGTVQTLFVGPLSDDNQCSVAVSGTPYRYRMSGWTRSRLLKNSEDFQ